jgi:hypothetical protein
MSGIVYQGRHANKESGPKAIQRDMPDIGRVKLVLKSTQAGLGEVYEMYRGEVSPQNYAGIARHFEDGSWKLDNYTFFKHDEPVGSLPVGSPYAVNVGGC